MHFFIFTGTCKFTSENRAATSKKQNIGKIGKQPSKDEDRKSNNLVKQSSKDSAKDFAKSPKLSEPEIPHKKESTDASINETVTGMFSLFQSFTLHGQISSVSVCKTASGQNQLMASQPGGGYVVLATYGKNGTETEQKVTFFKGPLLLHGFTVSLIYQINFFGLTLLDSSQYKFSCFIFHPTSYRRTLLVQCGMGNTAQYRDIREIS